MFIEGGSNEVVALHQLIAVCSHTDIRLDWKCAEIVPLHMPKVEMAPIQSLITRRNSKTKTEVFGGQFSQHFTGSFCASRFTMILMAHCA